MARRARDDYCLICSASPCECNEKKTAPRRSASKVVAKPEPATSAAPVPTQTKRAGLSAIKQSAPPPPAPVVRQPTPADRVRAADEAEEKQWRYAITTLARSGLLSSGSVEEHRHLIDMTDPEIRAMQWKQRREGGSRL